MLEKIEKFLSEKGKSFIFCSVCGSLTKIKILSTNLREDGICQRCYSNSRKRHLALIFLRCLKKYSKLGSYSALRKIPKDVEVGIYNVESNGSLHENLKQLHNYVCSEYFGPYEIFGKTHNGVLNVDLQNIPFSDNTFEYVISTEVFEHIPDPYKAFKEIHRILKPNGSHIFTVPFKSGYPDEVRARLDENNVIKHFLEPEYHGDPIRGEGILVFTIFAEEMIAKLQQLGFSVKTDYRRNPLLGILGDGNRVFIATKS